MNSLLVLVVFIAFLCTGYATLVAWFSKPMSPSAPKRLLTGSERLQQWRSSVLSVRPGYLVLLLLAMTLAMHWGWAPVLLWLVVGSLFISFNLHSLLSLQQRDTTDAWPAQLSTTTNTLANRACTALLTLFVIMVYTLLLVLSAEIISQHSGTTLMLACALLALYVVRRVPTGYSWGVAIAIGVAGLFLGDQMGLYIPGNWQPTRYLPGLIIDDRWLFCAAILFCLMHLSPPAQGCSTLLHRFCQLTAALGLALMAAVVVFLVVQRPPLDAPPHISGSATPHYLTMLMLVVSVGAVNLVQYLLRASEDELEQTTNTIANNEPNQPAASRLHKNHGRVFYDVICAAIIMCLLATSNGIGAWSTHFAQWQVDQLLINVLNLSIDAVASTLDWTGIHETTAKTVTAFIILLNSLLLLCRLHLLIATLATPLRHATEQPERYRHTPYVIAMGLAIVFLATGMDITVWLAVGTLALAGLTLIMVQHCHSLVGRIASYPLFVGITIALILISVFQLSAQVVNWATQGHWLWFGFGLLSELVYIALLWVHSRQLYSEIKTHQPDTSLDLGD